MKPFRFFPMLILFFFTIHPHETAAQPRTHSFDSLAILQAIQKRPVFIFIFTDWCRYCQGMEQTTLKNKQVVETLNREYYFLKLNAESRNVIPFNGKHYHFKPTGPNTGEHELMTYLFKNKAVGYPAMVFLHPDSSQHQVVDQFLSPKALQTLLKTYHPIQNNK